MKVLLRFFTLFAMLYLFILVIVQTNQSMLVYFPSKDIIATPDSIGLVYEDVELRTNNNTKLHAWYIPKKDAKTTLLFLHGNGKNISYRLDLIQILNSLGMNVLIVDYRGYGKSEGISTEKNTYDDARIAWKYLLENKNTKPEDIIIFGRSLGGAIAANLGSEVNPKGMILDSTLSSTKEFASDVYPFIPQSMIDFSYGASKYLKDINSPLLVLHSMDDEIIPYKHGRKVFQSANEPKRFVTLQGSHNESFLVSRELYIKSIQRFLEAID